MKILATTRMGLLLLGLTACLDSGFSIPIYSAGDICDSDPCGEITLASIRGVYALQSVDGEALPLVVSELTDPILVEVTAGSVTLNDDLTCSVSSTTRETMTDGTMTMETETEVCTYTFDSGAFTLTFPVDGSTLIGSVDTGSISGATLTITRNGSVWVFRR